MSTINASNLLAMRNAILQQNSALQKVAASPVQTDPISGISQIGGTTSAPAGNFASALRGAITQVNAQQASASQASEAYEKGETNDIAAVMLQREQANVGFQATLQVRNKLLSAYKDIMSMPV
jgi:flagellar hook-basal body complex protein FliE